VIRRVEGLVHKLDVEAPPVEVRFIPVHEAEATQLVTAVTQLINNRESYQWGSTAGSGISLTADERTNQIVVIAPPQRMAEVTSLIEGLDSSPGLLTRVYRLKSVSPDRIDRLVKTLLDASTLKRGYQASAESDSQLFVVSATPPVHARIEQLLQELDVPAPQSQNPIQFYQLKNTKAVDVLGTISGLLGESGTEAVQQPETAPIAGRSNEPTAAGAATPAPSPLSSPQAQSTAVTAAPSIAPTAAAPLSTGAQAGRTASPLSMPSGVTIAGNSNTQYVTPALPYTNEPTATSSGPACSLSRRTMRRSPRTSTLTASS
jgi:type II secretory pathway component GspD/PulD (secretin)